MPAAKVVASKRVVFPNKYKTIVVLLLTMRTAVDPTIAVLSCLLFLATTSSQPLETSVGDDAEWNSFKADFNKTYENPTVEQQHREVFEARLEQIRVHNAAFKEGKTSFELGVNFRSDLPIGGVTNGSKQFPRRVEKEGSIRQPEPYLMDAVRNEFDWRNFGAVSHVKDQGIHCRRASEVFAAVDAIESAYSVGTGRPVVLSAQQVLDCHERACNFASIDDTLDYAVGAAHGIVSESSYPYTGIPGNCHFDKKNVTVTIASVGYLQNYSEDALKTYVYQSGPVAADIDADHESFISYKSGVYYEPQCNRTALSHGVLVVGYGVDKVHGDFWLLKNSWGESWGESGYMRIARNRGDSCGITANARFPNIH